MKPLPSTPPGVLMTTALLLAATPAWSQFTTLDEYGNAGGTGSFTQTPTAITITGGGADFWGNSDQGVFLWNDTGAYTTSGDFTATVRHVSTTTPAPEWGRDGIIVRATQSPGTPSANDAHWLVHRKSNGQFLTGRRPSAGAGTYRATDIDNAGVNFNSDDNERSFQTGRVTETPFFLAAGREGDRLYSGYALDLGGVAGRWIAHWSTDNPDAVGGLQGGAEVVVGLAHQSHPQTISPDTNDINTATFDNWTYAGTFIPNRFGPPAGPNTWQLDGSISVSPSGAVRGSAYVQENGVATGEPVKWSVRVFRGDSFVPVFGVAGSSKDPLQMEPADLVPPANFRHLDNGTPKPGLKADIYLAGNAGNYAALNAIVQGRGPDGTAIIPNVHWGHPDTGVGYPTNGMGGNLFTDAVPSFSDTGDGQEDYGVNLTGEIFIPGDAARVSVAGFTPEAVLFKDGVDDFCYLEIDGVQLINDNDWTGNASVENGGGAIAMLDVSHTKYNDGEWVPFRMMTWEGGGGDTASLYWSAADTNGTFGFDQIPGTVGNFTAIPGLAGAKKDPRTMEVTDLVPPAHFRHLDNGTPAPGLKADIYMQGNAGSLGAFDTLVNNNTPDGTAIIPFIHWSNNPDPPYPPNGAGGNLFADAVPGSFEGNQENYGVNMTGEIFIPSDANRKNLDVANGNNYIAFEDGVDDFCYLEIDGVPLINDNEWTGNSSFDNGGGAVSILDVSAPKFDDGEWVPFRMVMWEGGGGDTASLYWSALDTNKSFARSQLPGTSDPDFSAAGVNQVGSHDATAAFGALPNLPPGEWIILLDLTNTGTSVSKTAVASVGGGAAAPQITSFAYTPATTTLNLSFSSSAGSTYALEYTTGLQPAGAPPAAAKWNVVPGYGSIPGAAGTTTITPLNTSTLVTPGGLLPNNGTSFFRIRRL